MATTVALTVSTRWTLVAAAGRKGQADSSNLRELRPTLSAVANATFEFSALLQVASDHRPLCAVPPSVDGRATSTELSAIDVARAPQFCLGCAPVTSKAVGGPLGPRLASPVTVWEGSYP